MKLGTMLVLCQLCQQCFHQTLFTWQGENYPRIPKFTSKTNLDSRFSPAFVGFDRPEAARGYINVAPSEADIVIHTTQTADKIKAEKKPTKPGKNANHGRRLSLALFRWYSYTILVVLSSF